MRNAAAAISALRKPITASTELTSSRVTANPAKAAPSTVPSMAPACTGSMAIEIFGLHMHGGDRPHRHRGARGEKRRQRQHEYAAAMKTVRFGRRHMTLRLLHCTTRMSRCCPWLG